MPSDDQNEDEEEHEMIAEAFVPASAELTDNGLAATQQLDFAIQKWVCSCGKTWGKDERDQAEKHLRENTEVDENED